MNLALASNLLAKPGRSGRSSKSDIDITFLYFSHNGELNWSGIVIWLLVIAVIIGLIIWFNRRKAKLMTRSTTHLGTGQPSNPDLTKRLK
jgi:hypothetical protein